MKTLFTLLFISVQLFAFGQIDTTKEVITYAMVDLPPATRFCQEELGDFKACFIKSMITHARENFKYPAIADSLGFATKVYVNFVVEKDASISNAEITLGAEYKADPKNEAQMAAAKSINEEAIRVVESLQFLAPAKVDQQPVRMSFVMVVNAGPPSTNE